MSDGVFRGLMLYSQAALRRSRLPDLGVALHTLQVHIAISGRQILLSAILLFIAFALIDCAALSWAEHERRKFKEEEKNILKQIKVIKLEVDTTRWRQHGNNYDIKNSVKQKLEDSGFLVVQENSDEYDAIMRIDYKEIKGGEYKISGIEENICCGTIITSFIRLYHNDLGMIFQEKISGSTPIADFVSRWNIPSGLYMHAIRDFQQKPAFVLLGSLVTLHLGGVVRDPRVIEALIHALKDANSSLQMSAVTILEELKDPRTVGPMIDGLKDKALGVRQGAAKALGELKDPRAVEPLIVTLKDKEEDSGVRRRAAEALARIGDPRAVEPLVSALNDNYEVRLEVAKALGAIGDDRAIKALEALVRNEPYDDIRKAAQEALAKIQKARKR